MVTCRDWYASWEQESPGSGTLRIRGICEVPGEGYTAQLQPLEPQGINLADLLMKLVIQEPDTIEGEAADLEVVYETQTDHEYECISVVFIETISSGFDPIPVRLTH
jgi:hypothetical protein